MPSVNTYPGVYVQELPSTVHSIAGVGTSIAAFVGHTERGIDNRAQVIFGLTDYERLYGGLAIDSEVSYAVRQFFQNGGTQAYVVRTPKQYANATDVKYAKVEVGELTFEALSSGTWANGKLLVDVDVEGIDLSATSPDKFAFNLTITNLADGTRERFPGVTLNAARRRYVQGVVNDPDTGSQLVTISKVDPKDPQVPMRVSGVLGKDAVTNNILKDLTGKVAGGTATADNSFLLKLPVVKPDGVTVKVFAKGDSVPGTLSGIALKLQQAINAVLAVQVPGASVVCSVSPTSTGEAFRINAMVPSLPGIKISFEESPTTGTFAGTLGLNPSDETSPAHYPLGVAETDGGSAGGIASVPSGLPGTSELVGDPAALTGIYSLTKVDLFNLLSIPEATRASRKDPYTTDGNIDALTIYSAAMSLCLARRAMLLVDPPPELRTVAAAVDWKSSKLGLSGPSAAAFFPRLRLADPLDGGQLRSFAPSGVVAGVYASTDAARGVWKAPAGVGATLSGVQSMTYQLNDLENGVLNPLGLNCFRTFPNYGPVLWGARTLEGADAQASQWKYVPVRRTALFIEESLYRGTKWVVFEPNDESLWSTIRMNVNAFMDQLFRKGAFQGRVADQAYFVKCDAETTTQADIDLGVVNILVGFAPVKPAEFVVIQIGQMAGQLES